MRQGPHQKRSRGRGNGGRKPHSSPRNHTYDSNGPEVRIRGTAYQVHEKYMALARDASSAGDRIRAENLLQHAEHYLRIIQAEEAAQAEYEENQQRHNGNRNQGGERNYEPRDRFRDDRQSGDNSDEDSDGQVVMLNRHSQDESQGDDDSDGRSSDRQGDRQSERQSDRQSERRQASHQGERRPRPSRDENRDEDDADGLQRMMGLGGGAPANGAPGEGDEDTAPRRGPLRRPRRSRSADAETPEAVAAPEASESGEAAPVRRRRAPRSRSADAEQGTLPVEEESGAA